MKKHIFLLLAGFTAVISCQKTSNSYVALPAIFTTAINSVTGSTAVSGGYIASDSNGAVIARGVCWSIAHNPTIADNKTTDGAGIGTFTSSITGLHSNTTYYVRAYATNSIGTQYGNEVSFTTVFQCGDSITDIDGNVYHTIGIGSQCWMVENLKTSHYTDGNPIITGLSDSAWSATTLGAYSVYDNDVANNSTYGKLYNWYAVYTGKLAPTGWHVPSDAEWTTMINYLAADANNKLRETGTVHWAAPNAGATNESGFTALPAGNRTGDASIPAFMGLGSSTGFWTLTEKDATNAYMRNIEAVHVNVDRYDYLKSYGFSIRCIKN